MLPIYKSRAFHTSMTLSLEDVESTRKFKRIRTIFERPFGKQIVEATSKKLWEDIHSLKNFHRYPNRNRQLEKSIKITSRSPTTFSVSVKPVSSAGYPYGSIIEEGRPAITGKYMKFQGYYPNVAKLYSVLRKRLTEDLKAREEDAGMASYKRSTRKKLTLMRGHLEAMAENLRHPETSTGKRKVIATDPVTGARTYEVTGKIYSNDDLKREVVKKYLYPVGSTRGHGDDLILKALNDKNSDLYTVVINPYKLSAGGYDFSQGVKAAYEGKEPRIMSNLAVWIEKKTKKAIRARLRKIDAGYEPDLEYG